MSSKHGHLPENGLAFPPSTKGIQDSRTLRHPITKCRLDLGKKGNIRVDGQDELQNGQIAASTLDDDIILAGLNRSDE